MVTSVAVSNALKKEGFQVPSIFFRDWTGSKEEEIELLEDFRSEYALDNVNCYTASELWEFLPNTLEKGGWENWKNNLLVQKSIGKSKTTVEYGSGDAFAIGSQAITLADALGTMIIQLMEKKLI